jgi:hypothetical protein
LSTSSGLNLTLLPAVAKPYLVNALYDLLLQRTVDPAGLAAWSAALGHGQSTLDVARGIVGSPEARAQQVQSLYGQILHRPADPTGLASFSAALQGGQTLEQVAAALVGSPEYAQTRGGGSAAGFLNALYQDALGRSVDATGLSDFSQALAQGVSHRQVADQVFASDEFRQNLVDNYYRYFLLRPAEPAGRQAWTDDLRHGVSSDQVLAGIVGSPEMLGFDHVALPGTSPHSSGNPGSSPRGPGGAPGGGGPGSAGKLGNPLPYQAFDPSTVADTTNAADPNYGPLAAGGTKTWNVVPGGGLSGTPIPAGAKDLVLTVTVLNPAAGGGTLQINPGAGPAYPTITVDPNVLGPSSYVVVAPVGAGGTVAVTSSFVTDLALDVDGFYLSTLDPGDQFPISGNIAGQGTILGQNASTAPNSSGVVGQITSTDPDRRSAGLRGINNGTGNFGTGVLGIQNGSGIGVDGTVAGAGFGVVGQAGSNGTGVYGDVTGSGDGSAGVRGLNFSTAADAFGVIGQITSSNPGPSSTALRGINNGTGPAGIGVWGEQHGSGYGVYGSVTGAGLGVVGQAGFGGTGVWGSGSTGVFGTGSIGVLGNGTANGDGVRGINSGTGLAGTGVYGSQAGSGYGVYGTTSGAGVGVVGAKSGVAGSRAGVFFGNVDVFGTLSKGGGSFKIDDPIDPLNKYLYHSFVESPDMLNIYNGNVTTDANGNATVTLPDYFMALNQDYRYQLTPIGQFAQTMVSSGVQDNKFSIRTDKPNVQVSWQVTGIRHDPWANANRIPTEVAKTGTEVGHYLYPEVYGLPKEQGITYIQHPQPLNTGGGPGA